MTRPKIEDYPILHGPSMSQVWNGRKMLLDLPPHLATPTARNAGKIFWVNELTQLADNSYFIPSRFFYLVNQENHSRRALTALGWRVVRQQVSRCCLSYTLCIYRYEYRIYFTSLKAPLSLRLKYQSLPFIVHTSIFSPMPTKFSKASTVRAQLYFLGEYNPRLDLFITIHYLYRIV